MKRIFPSQFRLKVFAFLFLILSFVFANIWQPAGSSAQINKTDENTAGLADSPVFREFDLWVAEYSSGHSADDFIQKGEQIAARRKAILRELIQSNPRQAIRLAIPDESQSRLPFSISRHLEKSLSFKGDFLIRVEDAIDSESGEFSDSRVVREVVFDGAKYKAFVYGRKSSMTTKYDIPLRGVCLDDLLVVDEDSVRAIEPTEYAARHIDATRFGADGAAAEVGGAL